MKCKKEAIELMHRYLDGDILKEEETTLRKHLEECETCQQHFHELKRTVTLLQSTENIQAPDHFTASVMAKLPPEKKHVKYIKWFKLHPVLTAAAIFFIFMFGGVLTSWNQDNQLVVSKQEDLIIDGETVIVPHDVTVEGDLVVKNGNLIIEGTVDGNVTIINGQLIDEQPFDQEGLMASVGEVNGELTHVDQVFEWMLYHIKSFFKNVFAVD
ncbi:zf-HC2 domain-containing protein [Oceanobacillus halotolerans]|uniref:zf-HC2 domain-containing protein n=1 Tax=Oceanobacillus halotolerans TaxID=2663380 RepID=UPI0013DB35BB|nr:zf-HC2 domain-containing protein [Oceanobacillus halotolerans]